MSARAIGDNGPRTPSGAGAGSARRPRPEELLAEFREALEAAGYAPPEPKKPATAAPAPRVPPAVDATSGKAGVVRKPRSRRWPLTAAAIVLGFAAVGLAAFAVTSLALRPSA